MPQGKIKTWIRERGFGFITPDDHGPDMFVHAREFQNAGLAQPEVGERLSYDVDINTRSGRPAAVNLKAAR